MDKLKNANRSDILRALSQARAQTRAGTITGYDPDNYMATVEISPELMQTGWLPILTPWAGDGFGFYAGPEIGTQVVVLHLEDDFESGMVLLYANDDSHRPLAVPSGELWAVHKTGSLLKFLTSGDVALTSHNDLNVTVGGDLNANVTGNANVTATGNAVVAGAQVLLGASDASIAVKLADGSNATKVFAK